MKFSLSWLKRFLNTELNAAQISEILTSAGIEVEHLIDKSAQLRPFVVAKILKTTPHPDADKLNICEVDNGTETLQIICGAPNARIGLHVVLAPIGTTIPINGMVIERRKIRSVESQGMLCSYEELGLGKDSNGIIELPDTCKIGTRFIEACPEHSDPVFTVSVTPNRSDCLGVYGIARDIAAKGAGQFIDAPAAAVFQGVNHKNSINPHAPLFAYAILKNIKTTESPQWLKALLENSGSSSFNAIVDVTNYINLSFARPMHAYDKAKIKGNISVRNSQNKETMLGLNGIEYTLSVTDLVVADDEKICAIAGVIGSDSTKCDNTTKDIVLEAAVFDSVCTSTSARRLGIQTESSKRFEYGVDHNNTLTYLSIAIDMLKKICGAEVEIINVHGQTAIELKTISLKTENVNQLTGLSLSVNEIAAILESLGFKCKHNAENLLVTVPSWRAHDVSIKEDLIEEVVRIYGYDNITPTAPSLALVDNVKFTKETLYRQLRTMAAFRGCFEVVTWSFMHSELAKTFGIYRDDLLIKNPISSELDIMRGSIIPNLLQAVHKNNLRGFEMNSFFEIGPVFNSGNIDDQALHFACIRSGNICPDNIYKTQRSFDFFDIKKDALEALNIFGIAEHELKFQKGTECKWYHPFKSASVIYKDQIVARLGEIHSLILRNLKIKYATFGCELFLDKLPSAKRQNTVFASDYQEVSRDLAFIVNKDLEAGTIINTIRNLDTNLIKEVRIFDIFINAKIGDDKKSLAINIKLQSLNKTLTEAEIEGAISQIIQLVEKQCGGYLRQY